MRRACWYIASRLHPTSWARRDTAPHCPLNTAAALPIHVTTDKLHMLVRLLFSGMMLPGNFQEVHVLYARQIVNWHSDKKQYFEIMSLAAYLADIIQGLGLVQNPNNLFFRKSGLDHGVGHPSKLCPRWKHLSH